MALATRVRLPLSHLEGERGGWGVRGVVRWIGLEVVGSLGELPISDVVRRAAEN
jgi:hypothetical protein